MFGDENRLPWPLPVVVHLPGYYREKYGRELANDLPALHDAAFPDAAMIRYRYIQCLHEMLRDNYHKPLAEWCEKNHIAYVTEIPSLRMSNQRYSHVPGSDPNHDKLGFPLEKALDRDLAGLRSNSKVVSSIARQFDRRDCLDEHSTPSAGP
jgi:hypothetical protein